MRLFVLLLMSINTLMAFDYKLEFGLAGNEYSKYSNEITADGDAALGFKNSYFKTDARVDFLYSSEYKERRYLLLNELYLSKNFGAYSVSIGKKIKYWGELEGFNIADVYNQKNYLKDPFDKSAKYGAIGADITRYFDENSLEFGMKLYEADEKLPQGKTPYAPFLFSYDKKLRLSDKRYTPTLYLKSNLVTDKTIDSETSIILLRGYDNKRTFIPLSTSTLAQYAYRVNKVLFLSHLIYNDTIFKTELAYTDVIDDASMSNYTQLSFGVEKSFYEVIGQADITLFAEYYKYLYSDDAKTKNVDISEVYNNDAFLALKLNLNDTRSSEVKVGVLQDLQKNERVIKATLKSRILDSIIVKAEYLSIATNNGYNTLLSQFGSSSRFTLNINYTF